MSTMLRFLPIGFLLPAAFALAGGEDSVAAPTPIAPAVSQKQASDFTDKEVLAVWEALEPGVQEEVVGIFRVEVEQLPTFQNGLLKFLLDQQTRDASEWPLQVDLEPYDPEVHAPAQPIRRKKLAITSPVLEKKRKSFAQRAPERKLDSAWRYDYGTREVQRLAEQNDPDRLFRNGLNGFPPRLDLAEALLELQLDDGTWQSAAVAFEHPYTDREGNVYTGLTLYDAWASGTKMEMPDVDCLGILHDLEDDWKTFVAPVSEGKQKKLYDQIGALFEPLHYHRGLRHAMALTFLTGYPTLRDGYYPNLDRLHSLWDENESTPEKLVKDLPDSKQWESFLKKLVRKVDKSKKLREAAEKRRDTLHNDGLWVRQTLINILLQTGLLK